MVEYVTVHILLHVTDTTIYMGLIQYDSSMTDMTLAATKPSGEYLPDR